MTGNGRTGKSFRMFFFFSLHLPIDVETAFSDLLQ